MRLLCLAVLSVCVACDQRTTETYRLSAHLIPSQPDDCPMCPHQFVVEAVPVNGGDTRNFEPGPYPEIGFLYRWGVEQTVEVEHWRVNVPERVADDSGNRRRMVRVLESRPVAEGSSFEMPFQVLPPGNFHFRFEREGARLRLSDSDSADVQGTSVLLDCPTPALCDQVAALQVGKEAFVLTLAYPATESDPLILKAVRSGP